jgi:hypothetical protein
MQYKKFTLSALILLGFGLTGIQAQQAVTVTGGEASGSGGSTSYSVGQVVYSTHTGTNGSVAQGVQQPFEISVVSAIEEAKGITLECSVYPNPATDILTLKVENVDLSTLTFQLYDMQGKLLESKKVEGRLTNIGMSNLAPANYFLKVTEGNKELKTFKIIRN